MILLENPKAPLITFHIWYRAGARNEAWGRTGLSHVLEHMMFKGTKKYGPEYYSRIIQENGGETNAFASRDYTGYFATLRSARVQVVMDLEADRMQHLNLREEDFVTERMVVMEERRQRTEDDPQAFLMEQVWPLIREDLCPHDSIYRFRGGDFPDAYRMPRPVHVGGAIKAMPHWRKDTAAIIGYFLMGTGFLVEGFFPAFLPILLAQVIWGLGYTFTSGATQAWISDEIGEDDANKLFMRATQIGLFAALIGMGLATLVGANNVAMPLQLGAAGVLLIGITLAVIMPETGFHPTPREDRTTWQLMWHTFKQGVDTVRAKPRLMNIVFIGLFCGIYSEGFDRLWVKHLLDTFELPVIFGNNQVAFFAALRVATTSPAPPAKKPSTSGLTSPAN